MRRALVVALVATCAVLALEPAASAQQGSTTAPRSAAPVASPGLTDTSVRVGGIGFALLYGGADVGARARFQRANDAGGVNGRKIDYIGMRDDGGDPANSAKVAAQLVQQDRVFAVVPTVTPALAAGDFVNSRVPYFGWALSSHFCTTKLGFGFDGCATPPESSVASDAWPRAIAAALGGPASDKAVALLAENTDAGNYGLQMLNAGVASVGLHVATSAALLPVPAVGDYGAIAKKVMASNAGKAPDAVFVVGSYSNVLLLRRALLEAGYAGVFTDSIEYDPRVVAAAAGAFVFLQTAPVESASTLPPMRQLVDDVRKIAPAQPIDSAVIAGYLSADLFVQVLGQRPNGLTNQSFLRAASRFIYEVPGVVGPVKFPKARLQPAPCGSLVQSDGVVYKPVVPYTCGKVVSVS